MNAYDNNGNIIQLDEYINVKNYGAKGNGTVDDSQNIQNAINACNANGGGVVYFPVGVYLIKTAILFYSNMTLLFDPGAVIKQGAAINSLMRNYSTTSIGGYDGTHDSAIIGATFDGGTYITNNTLLGFCHSKNILIKGCTFKNAYGGWHDIEINSSQYVTVEGCDFSGARKTAENGEDIQIDGAMSTVAYPWDDIKIDQTVSKYIEIKGCHFHDNSISPAIGNHTNMAHKFIKIHDCIFEGNTGVRGTINFVASVSDIDIFDNIFNECSIGVGTSGATYYIHDNRFLQATTAISGESSVSHANMINGVYTA